MVRLSVSDINAVSVSSRAVFTDVTGPGQNRAQLAALGDASRRPRPRGTGWRALHLPKAT